MNHRQDGRQVSSPRGTRSVAAAVVAATLVGFATQVTGAAAAGAPRVIEGPSARVDGGAGPAVAPVTAPTAVGVGAASGDTGPWRVAEALWDRPRSGASVRADPGVQAAVRAWLATPGARLAIRYGSGQNGEPRAAELRQWLVALGVEPRALSTESADRPGSALELAVSAPRR